MINLAVLANHVCHPCSYFYLVGDPLPDLRGTEDLFGLPGAATIINSTLGKALGGASGGYTVGPKEVVTLCRQKSRPYLFSNSLPPPIVGAASKVSERGSDCCCVCACVCVRACVSIDCVPLLMCFVYTCVCRYLTC